ncbi:MAG: ATP-binding cassette domain-containing protein [Alphaproteobacteria bacterium]
MSKNVLELTDIGLRYPSGTEVLHGISCAFPAGSFHFLTGPSGAGKSSLLRLCYLAERPTSGGLALYGQDMSELPRGEWARQRRRIGVVFQDFRLIPHLTAAENVALPLLLAGAKPKDAANHARELLAWSGIGEQADAYPAALSGGQQQRVAIARAVINRPGLLFADEPTGNIDEASAERVMALFVELNKMGTTVILATHDRTLVKHYGFPSLHIRGGKLHPTLREAAE